MLQAMYAPPYMLLCGIIFSSLLYHLHLRSQALETPPHHHVSMAHIMRLLDIQRTTILALTTTQNVVVEGFDGLSAELDQIKRRFDESIAANLDQMDADIAALSASSKLHREQMWVLGRNLDMAREVLGAGVESSVDDGLEMGDEMSTFWADESFDEDAGEGEEEIDVEASDEMVSAWIEELG